MAKIMIANTAQLKEHFNEKLKTYIRPLPVYNSIDVPNLTKSEQKTFILEYIRYMFVSILLDIPEILESAILSYNKDISFLIDDESKKKYIIAKAEELEKKHQKNRYSNIFSVDGFHNEVFTNRALEAIVNELFIILDKEYTIDSFFYENEDGEIDYSNPNLSKIEDFKIVNKDKFRDTFFVILKTMVLKLEYHALSNTSTSQSILPIIPSNEPYKSEEISIVPPNPYLLVQNRSEEKQMTPPSSLNFPNDTNEVKHPPYDPNFGSKDCYSFFKYLFENYYLEKSTKQRLINIWYFLSTKTEDKMDYNIKDRFRYKISITRAAYIRFIKEDYNIKLTNYRFNEDRWDEEVSILYGHLSKFKKKNT